MLFIEKITKMDEQMDEVVVHAWIIRINAWNVGRVTIRYRWSLVETDASLEKIENRGFAFLSLAKEVAEEID